MVLEGWELLYNWFIQESRFGELAFLVPALISVIIFLRIAAGGTRYWYRKFHFKVEKNRQSLLKQLTGKLCKLRMVKKLLTHLSIKVSMYTGYSTQKNMEIACVLLLASTGLSLLMIFSILQSVRLVWYMLFAYLALTALIMALLYHVFSLVARARFTSKLPGTFKLLNSRYTSKGNILKAIAASMDDFDRAVKKEMHIIYDVLKKNDMQQIDHTFMALEQVYKNEYFTLLLTLIRQAHYKGGKAAIKEQFEEATEEILIDIENQKDLEATSRSYILLVLAMPACLKGVEMFNASALGPKSVEFYTSLHGIEFKMLFLAAFVGFVAYLLFLERTA